MPSVRVRVRHLPALGLGLLAVALLGVGGWWYRTVTAGPTHELTGMADLAFAGVVLLASVCGFVSYRAYRRDRVALPTGVLVTVGLLAVLPQVEIGPEYGSTVVVLWVLGSLLAGVGTWTVLRSLRIGRRNGREMGAVLVGLLDERIERRLIQALLAIATVEVGVQVVHPGLVTVVPKIALLIGFLGLTGAITYRFGTSTRWAGLAAVLLVGGIAVDLYAAVDRSPVVVAVIAKLLWSLGLAAVTYYRLVAPDSESETETETPVPEPGGEAEADSWSVTTSELGTVGIGLVLALAATDLAVFALAGRPSILGPHLAIGLLGVAAVLLFRGGRRRLSVLAAALCIGGGLLGVPFGPAGAIDVSPWLPRLLWATGLLLALWVSLQTVAGTDRNDVTT